MSPKIFLTAFLAIATSPLLAQTSGPSAPPAASTPSATSTVYFYRLREGYGALLKPSVFSDGAQLGRMRNGRFFSVQIPAGTHNITSMLPGNGARVEMKAGATYYFKLDISRPGLMHGGRGEVTEVTQDQGAFAISQLKPAEPKDTRPDGGDDE
jgi:hypothetical protein